MKIFFGSNHNRGSAFLIVLLLSVVALSVFFLNQGLSRNIELSDKAQMSELSRSSAYDLVEIVESPVSSEDLSIFNPQTGQVNIRGGAAAAGFPLVHTGMNYLPFSTAIVRMMQRGEYDQLPDGLRLYESARSTTDTEHFVLTTLPCCHHEWSRDQISLVPQTCRPWAVSLPPHQKSVRASGTTPILTPTSSSGGI